MATTDDAAAAQQPKTKVSLRGVPETLMVTLLARAEDAASPQPILHDDWARRVLERLDYALPPEGSGKGGFYTALFLRAALLDAWATEFLSANPEATVLHLGCGLDSRALRLAWGPRVRWIDVDLPEVVELRQEVYLAPAGDYRLIAASVTDDAWLDDIPADRPTLIIMEGLLPYLEPDQARRLVGRLCTRFPGGRIMFDVVGWLYIRLQAFNSAIHHTGAVMHFGVDNAHDFLSLSPKLAVRDVVRMSDVPGSELFPWDVKLLGWIGRLIPPLRSLSSYFCYDF